MRVSITTEAFRFLKHLLTCKDIEHAYHALALDEHRKAFRPTLWYIDNEMRTRLAQEGKPLPELKQVWFPGVHINAGGGSDDCITDMKGDLESKFTPPSSLRPY